jgi:NADH:ubiquinone oxidoreductase subunit F (NADH-binding)
MTLDSRLTTTRVLRRTGHRTSAVAVRGPVRTAAPDAVIVESGPALLGAVADGPGLRAHRAQVGATPILTRAELAALTDAVDIRGRGGAGFPFATKLRAMGTRRAGPVVINASEGEPASAKDTALLLTAPHRVLDGAVVAARALGVREVRVVTPGDRPAVGAAAREAVAERHAAGERMRWRLHEADPVFVAGQARAVLELLAGRENRPVTSWAPEAVSGHRGRPTLLSNAETFAHVGLLASLGAAAYAELGREGHVGTTLLTITLPERDDPVVREVPAGARWTEVLPGYALASPVLLGGFHGTWVPPGGLLGSKVDRQALAADGWALGAGVVIPLPTDACPVEVTSHVVAYLASQSAGRCGPCWHGLPELAVEVGRLATRTAESVDPIVSTLGLLERRGACAHPDGTVRLVRSMLQSSADEVQAHLAGVCRRTETLADLRPLRGPA